jgi:hypothetical protein
MQQFGNAAELCFLNVLTIYSTKCSRNNPNYLQESQEMTFAKQPTSLFAAHRISTLLVQVSIKIDYFSQLRTSLIVKLFAANNASSMRGNLPKISWKMPPSLVDHLMPRYESPPDLTPISSIINLPSLQLPKSSPGMEQPSKQAARLIVIRRGKMKKHKRRKLLKRMRFEWTKVFLFQNSCYST